MTQPLGLSFNDSVKQAVYEVLSDPLAFPDVFKGWVTGWIEANPPTLPISQITGFSQTVPQQAQVLTSEGTTSTTYTDLATVGPQLTVLPNGKYLILHGCRFVGTTDVPWQSVQTNSDSVSDNDGVFGAASASMYGVKAVLKSLSSDSNSVTLKYKSGGGASVTIRDRWLVVIRYGNL